MDIKSVNIFDEITEVILEDFCELELEELESSSFFGVICCCNTMKPKDCSFACAC